MRPVLYLVAGLLACAPFAAAPPARAVELPPRKPGLWETRALIDGKLKVVRRCFKPGDKPVFMESVNVDSCRRTVMRTGPGFLLQAECRVRELELTGRMQVAGDFDSEVRGGVRSSVHEIGDPAPPDRTTMTFTSRRVGDCPR